MRDQEDGGSSSGFNRLIVFISHTSNSLKDSTVFWPSTDNAIAESAELKNGILTLTKRSLQAFPGKGAAELLEEFCQVIAPGFKSLERPLKLAYGVAQQLFRAFDGKKDFSRDLLPLGLQGVQQVEWTKQNQDLAVIREMHRKRKEALLVPDANASFILDGSARCEHYCIGVDCENLVLIDHSMFLLRWRWIC